MTFVSDARNIFAHYAREEKSARFIANVTLNVESFVGTLPPFRGKRLYNAQVDPHLRAGFEVSLDVDMRLLAPPPENPTHVPAASDWSLNEVLSCLQIDDPSCSLSSICPISSSGSPCCLRTVRMFPIVLGGRAELARRLRRGN